MLVVIKVIQVAYAGGSRLQLWPRIQQSKVLRRFWIRVCLYYGILVRELERECGIEPDGVGIDNRNAKVPGVLADGIQRRAFYRTRYEDQFVLREEIWVT